MRAHSSYNGRFAIKPNAEHNNLFDFPTRIVGAFRPRAVIRALGGLKIQIDDYRVSQDVSISVDYDSLSSATDATFRMILRFLP